MKYADGSDIRPGDLVQIEIRYRGTVVASMDLNEYLEGHEKWAYLTEGIMVDTDFAGLVHYVADATDELVLLNRPNTPSA